jgi:hypothetical protein
MRFEIIAVAFAMGLGAIVFGLGSVDPSRISLSGAIKLDGEPLERGTIRFILVSGADQPVADVAFIHLGDYAIARSDSMVPGTYLVRISGLGEEAMSAAAGPAEADGATSRPETVPARYNQESVLRVNIPRNGAHQLDFNLKR